MAARKTPVDKLNEAVNRILSEYEGDIAENVGEIVEAIGKKGVQAIRQSAQRCLENPGDYPKGWTMQTTQTRTGTTVTIYNKHPGLPHLLEYGHVTRNGTGRTYPRTPAHEHIKPVADELITTFENEVKRKL